MDRVTKSYLTDFKKNFGFESVENESELFEHFSNYTIVEPKTEYSFEIEDINIGADGTIGIDGFALLLNKQFINTKEELEDYLDQNKKSIAEVIFIQSKTSPKFDSKEISNFGFAVSDFIAESQTLKWSKQAMEKIELFNAFVSKISELKENPTCNLYYATLGRDEKDQNVMANVERIKRDTESENIFNKVNVELIGATDLQRKYKKIGQILEKSFEFPMRVTLPIINDVKESYIGVIDTGTIIELMTGDDDTLLSNVFYDNVRDYQGKNKVNSEISQTIQSTYKDSFSILNNGITIVAEELRTTRDTFTISNYQIINGCQTSHVLFENRELIDETIKVPLKLIISENEELTSRVIRSTNRQTEVKEQDLIAFSNFQKSLEDYYKTYSDDNRLYYERRSKQYNNKGIDRKRIIDKTTQIKSIASFYYDKPNMATRFFGALFTEFGDKLFKDNHKMIPYYVASYAIFKIDLLFQSNSIDKKYKKIKYHILTMFRHEIKNEKCPPFGSKKAETYCSDILNVLKDQKEVLKIINTVINKIDSLNYELDDNEISKSTEFVKKCLGKYY